MAVFETRSEVNVSDLPGPVSKPVDADSSFELNTASLAALFILSSSDNADQSAPPSEAEGPSVTVVGTITPTPECLSQSSANLSLLESDIESWSELDTSWNSCFTLKV